MAIGFEPISMPKGFRPLFRPVPASPPPRKQNPFSHFVGSVGRDFRSLVAGFAKRPKLFFTTLALGTLGVITGGAALPVAGAALGGLLGATAGGLITASKEDWKAFHEEWNKAHSWNRKLAALLRSPFATALPGAWTTSQILEGRWGEIKEHPLLTAVDIEPYAKFLAKGSLRTALMRTHGEDVAWRLAREHATEIVEHARIQYKLQFGRDIPETDRNRFIEAQTRIFAQQYRTHLKTSTLLREARKVLDEKALDQLKAANFNKDPSVVLKGWDRLAEGLSWLYLRHRQSALQRRMAREFFRYLVPGREQDIIVNRVQALYREAGNWVSELGISPDREAEILRHIATGKPMEFSPAERTFITRFQRFQKDLQDMLVKTGLYREYKGEIYYLGAPERWENLPHPTQTFAIIDDNTQRLAALERRKAALESELQPLDPKSAEARAVRRQLHRIDGSISAVRDRIARAEARLPLPARVRPLAASILGDRIKDHIMRRARRAGEEISKEELENLFKEFLQDYQHEIYHGVVPLQTWSMHIKAGKLREYHIQPRDLYKLAVEANHEARRLVEEEGYNPQLIFASDIRSRNVMPKIFPVETRHAGLLNPNRTRISRAYGKIQLQMSSEMAHTLRTVLGADLWEQLKRTNAVRHLNDLVADPTIRTLAERSGMHPVDLIQRDYEMVVLDPDTGSVVRASGKAIRDPGMRNWYAHKSFIRTLENYNRMLQPSTFNKFMRVGAGIFRLTALYLSPTYWIGNILGDQVMYAANHPSRWFRGWRALMRLEGHLGRKLMTAVRDTQGEKMFREFVSQIDPAQFMLDVSVGRSLWSLFEKLPGARKLPNIRDWVFKFGYGLGESIMYLGYAEEVRRLGISPEAARHIGMELARDVVYRLDTLGPVERGILRTVFPFYGWYKFVLRYMASLTFDHPYIIPILVRTAEQIAEEEQQGIPLKLSLRFAWGDSPDGKKWAMPASNILPWASQTTARLGTTLGFLYMAHPFIRAFVDAAGGGKVPFADDIHWDPVSGQPTSAKPLVHAVIRALLPQSDLIAQTFGFSLLSDEATQARLERFAQRHPQRWYEALSQAFGSPVFRYDPVRERYYSQIHKARTEGLA